MAFKHKKEIEEILTMKFEEYAKFLKKEIARAAKFGTIDAVICSQHTFADNKEAALILLGNYTGSLAQFFKKNKAEKNFAKGQCLFEKTANGVTMHIAINAGKAKPDKIKKGGKKLWAKLGVDSQFHKGELPQLSQELDKIDIGVRALEKTTDTDNDQISIKNVIKTYQITRQQLNVQVIPLIKDKNILDQQYTPIHLSIAKRSLAATMSLIDKIEEIPLKKRAKYQSIVEKAQEDLPRLKRILAKVKKALMATNKTDIVLNNAASEEEQNKAIQLSLKEIEQEFTRLDQLQVQALEIIDSLKKQ
jgi:hypothetical protein